MTALPTATVADFFSWGPCNPERWRMVLADYEDEPWTGLDVLNKRTLRDVSDADRLWVTLRPQLCPRPVLREFAYWCVEHQARPAAIAALKRAGMDDHARKLQMCAPVVDTRTADAFRAAATAAAAWAGATANANANAAYYAAARGAWADAAAKDATVAADNATVAAANAAATDVKDAYYAAVAAAGTEAVADAARAPAAWAAANAAQVRQLRKLLEEYASG